MNLVATSETVVAAPASAVWDALVKPDKIKQYMFGTDTQSHWQKGDDITWSGEWKGKTYQDKGKILSIEHESVLSYTHFSPLTGQEDKPENYHTIVIKLAAEGDSTRLTLTQDGNNSAEEQQHATQNWDMVLEGLKKVVEEE